VRPRSGPWRAAAAPASLTNQYCAALEKCFGPRASVDRGNQMATASRVGSRRHRGDDFRMIKQPLVDPKSITLLSTLHDRRLFSSTKPSITSFVLHQLWFESRVEPR